MKRIKKILLFIFFIMLFIPFTQVVHADDNCADVQYAVNELSVIETSYNDLDCDNATKKDVVSQCGKLKVKKAMVLEDIFKYNDEKVCSSIDLSSIISENSDNCSNELSTKLKEVSDYGMKIFYIIAPFILLLFGSLDFFKIVVGNNPEEIKKNRTNFFKRVAAFVLLFITPVFVNTIFSFTSYSMGTSNYICYTNVSFKSNISSGTVTGTYGGNNYSNKGQAIADAAKEIKEYTSKNNFSYGFPTVNGVNAATVATSKNTSKTICCATLVAGSLYKAGIYSLSELNYGIDSSPSTARFLRDKGWTLITNQKDLQAGDVMFFYTSGASQVKINGSWTKPGHVEIYAGNGRRYNTGNTGSIRRVDEAMGYRSNFIYAFRYPGN